MRRWVDLAQKRLLARGFRRGYDVMAKLIAAKTTLELLEDELKRIERDRC